MKSMKNAGNFDLRGKKTKRCWCGCCVVTDFREDYRRQLLDEEIRDVDVDCVEDHSLYHVDYGLAGNDDEQRTQRYN